MSKNLTEQIREIGIVPVIKLDDAAKAAPLAKALCEGGLPRNAGRRRHSADNRAG